MMWKNATIFMLLTSGGSITGVIEDFDNKTVKVRVLNDDGSSTITELFRSMVRTHHCS